jgi:plasmid stabilization system protein ParE
LLDAHADLAHALFDREGELMVETETSSTGVPEQAQAAKDAAINQASDLKDTALEHVGAMTDDAKAKASDVVQDVRRQLETQGEAQAKRAASALHDVGTQLSEMAGAGQTGPVADVTRQLADTSRRVATRLDESGVQGVGDDLRSFARRQPGLFLAAAGLAGFVVTRMMRSIQSSGTTTGAGADRITSGQGRSPAPEQPAPLDAPALDAPVQAAASEAVR